jgi:CRP-like cAMP-binding protein
MDSVVAQKVNDFFAGFPVRRYSKGQILIHAHDNPQYVYYLIQGRVKQYDISYRGDEVVLNTFKPPAYFPMSYAINKTANSYFFEAETDLELHLVPAADAVKFVKTNPDVLFDLLSRVYAGTDGLLGRLAHLMASSARSRLLYELLIESRRFGTPSGQKTAGSLTEGELGSRAGLTRETISREIQQLKTEGLISVVKNEILINDLDSLSTSISREL